MLLERTTYAVYCRDFRSIKCAGIAGGLAAIEHKCQLSAAALLIDCRHGVWSRVGRTRSGCIERAVRLPASRRQSSRYTGDTRELAMSRRT